MVRKDKQGETNPREKTATRSRAAGQKQKTSSSINLSPKIIPPPESDKLTSQGIRTMEDQRGFGNLRQRAEKQLQKEAGYQLTDFPAEAVRLIHELKVHQVELEMRNDELRQAQVQLEESRSKYVDLYDFAPVGYMALTGSGQIVEVNLTAATLLEKERQPPGDLFLDVFGRSGPAAVWMVPGQLPDPG
jgi:PAS domain-containing protein